MCRRDKREAFRSLSLKRSLARSVPFRPLLHPLIRSFGMAMPRVAHPAMGRFTRQLYLCVSCVRCYFRAISASGVSECMFSALFLDCAKQEVWCSKRAI